MCNLTSLHSYELCKNCFLIQVSEILLNISITIYINCANIILYPLHVTWKRKMTNAQKILIATLEGKM